MSQEQSIPLGKAREVLIERADGNLVLVEASESTVVAVAQGAGDLQMTEGGDVVRISHRVPNDWSGEAKLIVNVPSDVGVRIEQVSGNFEASDLGVEMIHARTIGGNATLADLSAAFTAETVHGNFRASDVGGDLQVSKVGGSARINDIAGVCGMEKVGGNVTLGDVEGHCKLGRVGGNLKLTDVDGHILATVQGGAKLSDISGHCKLEGVGGNLELADVDGFVEAIVSGSARVADISGMCKLERVGGNLDLADVSGRVEATVGGSANLALDIHEGQQIFVRAGGNINARIDTDDAEFMLKSAGRLSVHGFSMEDEEAVATQRSFKVGDGAARVELAAGGNLTLSNEGNVNFTLDLDLGDKTFFRSGSFDLSNLGSVISEQVQQRVREAMGRTEQKFEEAARRAEARAERAERRASGRDRRYRRTPTAPAPPAPPAPSAPPRPPEPVSNEERAMVLQMLEAGKITPEEADRLLAALGESTES